MSQPIEYRIREMLEKVEELLSLASEGLLKTDKFYPTKEQMERDLEELGKELEERDRLAIEKVIPKWRMVHKSNMFMEANSVNEISPLRGVLFQLLAKYGSPKSVIPPKNEKVISAGKPYDGKQYLRSILIQAKNSILIRDNYLKPEILDILSEYILDNPALKVSLIVGENNRLETFRVHYKAFDLQYPSKIEAKYVTKAQQDHPRYVLIDSIRLFTPDHSLDQWGISTVNIYEHLNKNEVLTIKQGLDTEWDEAIFV